MALATLPNIGQINELLQAVAVSDTDDVEEENEIAGEKIVGGTLSNVLLAGQEAVAHLLSPENCGRGCPVERNFVCGGVRPPELSSLLRAQSLKFHTTTVPTKRNGTEAGAMEQSLRGKPLRNQVKSAEGKWVVRTYIADIEAQLVAVRVGCCRKRSRGNTGMVRWIMPAVTARSRRVSTRARRPAWQADAVIPETVEVAQILGPQAPDPRGQCRTDKSRSVGIFDTSSGTAMYGVGMRQIQGEESRSPEICSVSIMSLRTTSRNPEMHTIRLSSLANYRGEDDAVSSNRAWWISRNVKHGVTDSARKSSVGTVASKRTATMVSERIPENTPHSSGDSAIRFIFIIYVLPTRLVEPLRASRTTPGIDFEVDWAHILDAVAGQRVSLSHLCVVPGLLELGRL
ncbi:hypothetical protein B0H13DRAFT_1926737 [Mycena leptocephala]|nr:hypothetical protein B0H13DRAFT_1926737 [Mycena leptocephala]